MPNDDRCAVCHSQLSLAIGIPDTILFSMLPRLGERLRDFLATQYTFAICEVCRASPFSESVTAEQMMRRYIDISFGGNEEAYRTSTAWDLAEQIRGLLIQELRLAG